MTGEPIVLLANGVAGAGVGPSAERLAARQPGLDALVEGVSAVERDLAVHSVGLGGWPNLLGELELDAAVMDGDTRRTGAVGALRGVVSACRVALHVLRDLDHEILVGAGAARFAAEIGVVGAAGEDGLTPEARAVWWRRLSASMTEEQRAAFPDTSLLPLTGALAEPDSVRDTTVFLCRDANAGLHAATSTSGWAWKYPGRLGDAPIAGAGFYADSRFGAAACTHTGEMAIRAGTARTIVLALRLGKTLGEAVDLAVEELVELETGCLGPLVIHALDARGGHRVVALRCSEPVLFWYWREGMAAPERREAEAVG